MVAIAAIRSSRGVKNVLSQVSGVGGLEPVSAAVREDDGSVKLYHFAPTCAIAAITNPDEPSESRTRQLTHDSGLPSPQNSTEQVAELDATVGFLRY